MNITIPRIYNDTREKLYDDLVMILDPLSFRLQGSIDDPLVVGGMSTVGGVQSPFEKRESKWDHLPQTIGAKMTW